MSQPMFSTSQSDFRTSQAQSQQNASFSYSESHLTQLPAPNFNFDDLRRRMNEFTTKFDAYIERGRRQVLSERNSFRARLSELNASHNHILGREAHEKSEIQSQITSLQSHADSQRTHRDQIKSAIASTQRAIDTKVAAQKAYAEKLATQSALNGPELQFWETYLGTTINGGGEDGLIRVTYTFAPARGQQEEQQAMFELQVPDCGSGGYEVVYTKPRLESEAIKKVVTRLNECRDIAMLLKRMRMLFQETMGERMILR
ncbi:kinetochore-associated Ndc80 complex subunit spc25 [Lithohypha guttulata]|uniref:kinetochore-associated Ndc80 complex subunit spc25 n=1 Tax=Lithohypha guttulata TaxID=1690604 RepID=UPI00315D4BA2